MEIRGIMITNGGAHSAAYWAQTSASQIADLIEIPENRPDDDAARIDLRDRARLAKKKFEVTLAELLVDHHDNVQTHERVAIAELGDARLAQPLDAGVHVDDPLDDVTAAAKGTLFEAHFAKEEVRRVVAGILHVHFATSMDIDRSRHADASGTEVAKAYHRTRAAHGAANVHAHIHHYKPGGELHRTR